MTSSAWVGGRAIWFGCLILMLAACAGTTVSGGAEILQTWKPTIHWSVSASGMAGVLGAGVAALGYARMSARRFDSLAHSQPRGAPARLTLVWLVWGWACCAALLNTAVFGAIAILNGGHPAWGWLILLLVACLRLGALISVGAVLGHWIGATWSAALAAVVAFVLILLSLRILPAVFGSDAASTDLAGMEPSYVAALVQGLGALAIAVACWLVLLTDRGGQPRWRPLTAAAVGGVVLVGGSFLPAAGVDASIKAGQPTYVCGGQRPAVCVLDESSRVLEAYARGFKAPAEKLRARGFRVPGRYAQPDASARVPKNAGVLQLSSIEESSTTRASDEVILGSLATPRGCPAAFYDVRVGVASNLLADWIGEVTGLTQEANTDFADFFAQPAATQQRWARTTYDALAACNGAQVRVPAGIQVP